MARNVDDLMKRFEERNGGEIRAARVICFTKVELMRSLLQLATLRACAVLGVPLDCLRPTLEMRDGKPVLGLVFLRDGPLPVPPEAIGKTANAYFNGLVQEHRVDVAHAAQDKAGYDDLRATLETTGEAQEAFLGRFKTWATKAA